MFLTFDRFDIKFVLIVLLFFAVLPFRGQHKNLNDTLQVRQIAQAEGLSQLNVLGITFDKSGYLWAGTEDGLNRFNGYETKIFSQENGVNKLEDDHIRSLVYTPDTLWLATNTRSILAYILAEDKFVPILTDQVLTKRKALRYANKIFELNERFMLAGTLKNCVLIDRKTLEVTILPLLNQEISDYILSVYKKDTNHFLIGTYFGGIIELDILNKKLRQADGISPFKNNPVYAFLFDEKFGLLIGSDKGLFVKNETQNAWQQVNEIEKNSIRCFYNWNKNQLLVGTYEGLKVLNKNTLQLQKLPIQDVSKHFFSDVEIIDIKADKLGGIWLASQGKGLFYYHPKQQKFNPLRIKLPNLPKSNFISIFNFLREGNTLWLATEFGFVKYDFIMGTYELYPCDRLCYTLAKDIDDNLWGGGFEQGLQKYNRKTNQFERVVFKHGKITDPDVIQITPFSNDSLWVATWSSGIYSVNLDFMSVKPKYINGKSISRARTSFIDSKNRVWIGTDEGLYCIADKKTRWYSHNLNDENSLSNDRIFCITEDSKGIIWVGTAKGLNSINTETHQTKRYEKQSGLPNDFIYGVLVDLHDNIWVSTNFGVSTLLPKSGNFKNYTEKDGLQNNEFNGKAAYQDSFGNLYFGGMNGFNVFHPDSIPHNKIKSETVIESVQLFGNPIEKNIPFTDSLYFHYNQNVLTFDFTNLNYLLPEKNRYQFKMEGFDKDWRPVTKERFTTYTNLNPGKYTFFVKGSNNDLVWGKPDSMIIVIQAPWYQSLFFKIAIITFIFITFISWFFYRDFQQKQKNETLQNMVRERTLALQKSNAKLSTSFENAEEQRRNISFLLRELNHRVKNNLQLMASLLDMQKNTTTGSKTKENLQVAQNRLFTIAKIHDIIGNENQNGKVSLDIFIKYLATELVSFMEEKIDLKFDLEQIGISHKKINPVGIILNELITNTCKHAFLKEQHYKNITIKLKKEEKNVRLIYWDNGNGISENAKKTNSLGLKLIKDLAVQLEGHLEIPHEKSSKFIIYFAL